MAILHTTHGGTLWPHMCPEAPTVLGMVPAWLTDNSGPGQLLRSCPCLLLCSGMLGLSPAITSLLASCSRWTGQPGGCEGYVFLPAHLPPLTSPQELPCAGCKHELAALRIPRLRTRIHGEFLPQEPGGHLQVFALRDWARRIP
jgi:hypothetical protein